jgi:hypothetical protein
MTAESDSLIPDKAKKRRIIAEIPLSAAIQEL